MNGFLRRKWCENVEAMKKGWGYLNEARYIPLVITRCTSTRFAVGATGEYDFKDVDGRGRELEKLICTIFWPQVFDV